MDWSAEKAPGSAWKLWCGCFALAAVLYGATGQRGPDWGDSGMFQLRVLQGDYVGECGLAQAHPLYIALGRAVALVPLGGLCARLSLLSGLGMAVTLANLAVLAAAITGRRGLGLLLALMLGTAQTPWLLSTMAEVYTWVAAGLSLELLLLFHLIRNPRWPTLAALGLTSGLGWSLHNLALLPLPAYAAAAMVLVWRRRLPAAALLPAAGAWLAGAGLYLWLIGRMALQTGSLAGAVHSALFGGFQDAVLSVGFHWPYMKWNLCFLAMNFLSLLGPLALLGFARLRRLGPGLALAVVYVAAVEVLFVIRYPRPDMFTFALPSLLMLAVAAAVGAAELAERSPRWHKALLAALAASVVVQPAAYALAPALARAAGVDVRRVRQLPFRDDLRYWLVPWKHDEHSAARFAEAALRQAAPKGLIVADGTARMPLEVVRLATGRHTGVTLVESLVPDLKEILARAGDRPVYVAAPGPRYTPDWLLDEAELTPDGVLFRVRWPAVGPGR